MRHTDKWAVLGILVAAVASFGWALLEQAIAGNALQNGTFDNSTANWTRSDTNRIRWTNTGFANGGSIEGRVYRQSNTIFTGKATQSFNINGAQVSQGIAEFRWMKRSENGTPLTQAISVRLLSPTSAVVWSWENTAIQSSGTQTPWNKVASPNFATTLRDYGIGTYTFELGWTIRTSSGSEPTARGRFDEVVMELAFGPPHSSYRQPAYWCARCHQNHTGLLPRMMRQPAEEKVCYQCHDGTGSVFVIQRYFSQAFHMPIENTTGDHQTRLNDPIKTKRHVECLDCHNPHVDRPPNHYANFPTNAASTKLAGVWGVSVSYGATPWVTASNYTVVPTVSFEYQLCFKCHSYYAYEGSPPVSPSFSQGYNVTAGYTSKAQTDQSKEFNTNNASYHPIVAPGRNLMTAYPNNLLTTTYGKLRPTSTIHCTDCHRAGATDSYSPKPAGPHGSPNPFILMGEWSPNVNRNHSSWNTSAAYGNHPILCFNCHDRRVFTGGSNDTGFKGGGESNLHSFHLGGESDGVGGGPARCFNCHSGVPHGSPRRRLLATWQDPPPYRTQWTRIDADDPVITGNPTGNYQESSCQKTMGGGNGHGGCD